MKQNVRGGTSEIETMREDFMVTQTDRVEVEVKRSLTFRVILQEEVEVAELAEQLWLHFALGFKDERIIAANSLGTTQKNKQLNFRMQFVCVCLYTQIA